MNQFTHKNHYIPQLYLKSWSSSSTKIWQYSLVVSNGNVPIWNQVSICEIGYQTDLYTGLLNGIETDEIEHFFQFEIEDPAKKVIAKIENRETLDKREKEIIIRFLAAQYVRTPARYFSHKPLYDKLLPQYLESTLKKVVSEIEYSVTQNTALPIYGKGSKWLPYKTEVLPSEDAGKNILKFEVLSGRQIWFLEIEKILNSTYKCLLSQQWEFIEAAPGATFYTSDDPVISVFGSEKGDIIGDGGWGITGTCIIFPLTPRFVMYTVINESEDLRIMQKNPTITLLLQRYIINHAFRSIFSTKPSSRICECRNRLISEEVFRKEKDELKNWSEKQSEAEKTYFNSMRKG